MRERRFELGWANAALRILSGAVLLVAILGVVGAVGILFRREPEGPWALALSLVLIEIGVALRRISRPLVLPRPLAAIEMRGMGCLRLFVALSLVGAVGSLAQSGAGAIACALAGLAGFALWYLVWLRTREPRPSEPPDGEKQGRRPSS